MSLTVKSKQPTKGEDLATVSLAYHDGEYVEVTISRPSGAGGETMSATIDVRGFLSFAAAAGAAYDVQKQRK